MTGLMPSGQMHLGHKMVIDQVRWFQEQGADVTIAVADLEANATRGYSLAECRKIALEEYVSNYVAMGLDPERTNIYFQSTRPIVQRMGFTWASEPTCLSLKPFTDSRETQPRTCASTLGSSGRYSAPTIG